MNNKPKKLDANEWNKKGIALRGAGRYKEAIACYNRAIKMVPKYWAAWYNKGNALGTLGRYDEAIACYSRAIEIRPKDADGLYNKGYYLDHIGRYREAITYFNRAIKIQPENPDLWNNKGASLFSLGRYKEALTCFDRAIETEPMCAKAHRNKNLALTRLKYLPKSKKFKPGDAVKLIKPPQSRVWISDHAKLGQTGIVVDYGPGLYDYAVYWSVVDYEGEPINKHKINRWQMFYVKRDEIEHA